MEVRTRYPVARPETTRSILERTFLACPELAPPAIRAQREPTVEDIIVIEEGCGLRPGRIGGIRLEAQWSEAGKGRKVPVVFNYG
jgi:D-aspartate oxidase